MRDHRGNSQKVGHGIPGSPKERQSGSSRAQSLLPLFRTYLRQSGTYTQKRVYSYNDLGRQLLVARCCQCILRSNNL